MDDITKEQKKVIDELRSRTIKEVTPKMLEDVSLFYRFAKARDYNLLEAESMLKNHIIWRKEKQIDKILTDYEPPEVLVKYVPTTFMCFAKDGSIVRLNDGGRTDCKGLWNLTNKKELLMYFAYIMEQDKERMIKSGRNLGTPLHSVIYDFENLSYANAMNLKSLQYSLYILKMFVDNYPESIRRGVVINAPIYFTWLFATIKKILPPSVLEKVGIFGTDGWKEYLLEFIDADDLPMYLGGNKTDPDGNPLCETFIQRGQPIPKRYLITKGLRRLSLKPDVEKLTVMPFAKEKVTFEIKEENTYLEWEFEMKHRDIDFSLFYNGETTIDFELVELIPKKRISASSEQEKGCIKCEKGGKYTIVFDNSYSWLHTKEVFYRVEINCPKSDEIYGLA